MTAASSLTAGVGLAPSEARAIIRHHSKSFSLASMLLGPTMRDEASGLYAYCRRADDAVDLVAPEHAAARVQGLRRELDDVYAGRSLDEPVLVEFQRLVLERHIPREYPDALLEGFQLDAEGAAYETSFELYRYCWCVAGSVGAMMCHVLGVRRERALVHAAHLGMAMQLTNICRDVAEDWRRGRLYLPKELAPGLEYVRASSELPKAYVGVCARAVSHLLTEAGTLYRSGDAGLRYLPFRARLAVATARGVYAGIGQRILAQDANVLAGRAYVSTPAKFLHVARAGITSLALAATTPKFRAASLARPLRFPEDVLPF
jgi:15-cis-phytoene synthase